MAQEKDLIVTPAVIPLLHSSVPAGSSEHKFIALALVGHLKGELPNSIATGFDLLRA
jgi:hypothetical protein